MNKQPTTLQNNIIYIFKNLCHLLQAYTAVTIATTALRQL